MRAILYVPLGLPHSIRAIHYVPLSVPPGPSRRGRENAANDRAEGHQNPNRLRMGPSAGAVVVAASDGRASPVVGVNDPSRARSHAEGPPGASNSSQL